MLDSPDRPDSQGSKLGHHHSFMLARKDGHVGVQADMLLSRSPNPSLLQVRSIIVLRPAAGRSGHPCYDRLVGWSVLWTWPYASKSDRFAPDASVCVGAF